MKIGLDLRFMEKGDFYSNFVFRLVQSIIKNKKDSKFKLYLNIHFAHIELGDNCTSVVINEQAGSLKEQTKFLKILNKDKNDLLIVFNYKKPIKYRKKYILFLESLVEFHYPPRKNIFRRYFDNFLLTKNISNAKKVICFNEQIKLEIIDKLNVEEDKISIIKAYFYKKDTKVVNDINIDIKVKYNIKGDYLIYNSGVGNYKNLDRLIDIFIEIKKKHIELNLIILDDLTIKDVSLRQRIIDENLQNRVYFIGNIEEKDRRLFYLNCYGVIFPSLYESFPFSMEDAISYNSKIIASDLKSTKDIFCDKITYFNPINKSSIYDTILNISQETKKIDYSSIFENYNITATTEDLINVIKEI